MSGDTNISDKPTKLKIEGPKQVTPGEVDIFHCSTDASFPSVNLRWVLNGKLMEEGVETFTQEKNQETISISTFKSTMDGLASEATLICFVEGMANELYKQKLVKILGKLQAKSH